MMKFLLLTALLYCTDRQAVAMDRHKWEWSAVWFVGMIVCAMFIEHMGLM